MKIGLELAGYTWDQQDIPGTPKGYAWDQQDIPGTPKGYAWDQQYMPGASRICLGLGGYARGQIMEAGYVWMEVQEVPGTRERRQEVLCRGRKCLGLKPNTTQHTHTNLATPHYTTHAVRW